MKKHDHRLNVLLCLFLCCSFISLFAQDDKELATDTLLKTDLITIKGRIIDAATKEPLFGAKVQSKDWQYSAMTDTSGNFTLSIPEYLNQVYISAPDYAMQLYPLQSRSAMEVALYSDQFLADYALQSPLYAQHTVAPRSVAAITMDTEIQSQLSGDMRTIIHSGTPGIGASMFIRGFNSLNIGAQPLVVLDGMIFDNQYNRHSILDGYILNPLSNISVDDIEDMTVLKDGSAMYGAKAANGVLLIKTKRGKEMATKIAFSGMYGLNERPQTPPLMNADQFRVYVSDQLKYYYSSPEYVASFPFLNDNPKYYDYKRYHNDHDWTEDVYQNSSTQSYNIGVSGGDDVGMYYLSMGYTDANSTLKNNDFTRFNARFNSDISLTSRFKFSFDLSYSQTDRNLRNDGFGDLMTSPSALALLKAPILIPYEISKSGRVTSDLCDEDFLGISNPVAIIEKGIGESSQTYLNLSLRPSFEFTKALKLSGTFNYSMNSLFEKFFRPDAGVADVYLPEEDGVSKNQVKAQNAKQISLSGDIHLDWKKQWEMHALNLTGGARFLSDSYKGEYGSGHNTSTDRDHNLSQSLSYRQTTGYDESWRLFSWYLRAEYALYEKYLLSVETSADASSRYGTDADMLKVAGVCWGIYPSAHAAWLISSEQFMRALPVVNQLKLRLSYGLSGNDNLPNDATVTYFGSMRYINQYTGKGLLNIGNTNLKPETVTKKNVGLDISLFSNRLSISGDLFLNTTSDLLAMKQHNYITGQQYYWDNSGKLENKGFELALNVKALNLKNFQWEAGGSISHYKNTISELPEGNYITSYYGGEILTAVGHPAALFYGYKTAGVFATTQEAVAADLKMRNATGIGYSYFTAGDMHFVDLHEDGIIDEKDKTIIGDPNPDFTGSFNTRFSYKRLSLNALFSFSYGNDVYNYVRSELESGKNLYNQSAAMLNRWVTEGQRTQMPKNSYFDPMGNSRFSDRWIEDGSFLRFKTLTISYDVPINWIFLSGFTVWASANNLWTYTHYLGSDPEVSVSNNVYYQGIDAGWLPQSRSYFIGLKLNL